MDQFIRELMRIAGLFESWACQHIDFDQLEEPWPYLLQDRFGHACLQVLQPSDLAKYDAEDCLRVALHLRLTVKLESGLPVPIDVKARNPMSSAGSEFLEYRIQTIRNSMESDDCVPFSVGDDPFDPDLGTPYFGLYGVGADGLLEHIADRTTYAEAVKLAQNLVPTLIFPSQD